MLASSATDAAVAIGTSAAAVAALATLAFLCYQWARDRSERRIQEEQKQASRISCWFTQTSSKYSNVLETPEFRVTGKLEWLNRSDDPVYSVTFIGLLATQEIRGFPLGRKRRPIESPDFIAMPVIAPRDKGAREYTWTFPVDQASTIATEFVLGWDFNDASGVTWLKTSRGHMTKVKPSPEARDALITALLPKIQDLAKEAEDTSKLATKMAGEATEIADKYGLQNEGETEVSDNSEN